MNNIFSYFFKLIIILYGSWVSSIYGTSSNSFLASNFYTTIGWHDGSRTVGFFIPFAQKQNSHFYWDTGTIFSGSGIGYRQMLDDNWLDDSWFIGGFFYYDVMYNITQFTLTPFLTAPTRLNIGGEVGNLALGQLTINFYGFPFPNPQISPPAKDIGGVSFKLSTNFLKNWKFFIGGSYAGVGFPWNGYTLEKRPSFIMGTQWVVNSWLDIETKTIWDEYQNSYHMGFRISFDGKNKQNPYFLHRPPERYIPHYAKSTYLLGKMMLDATFNNSLNIITPENPLGTDEEMKQFIKGKVPIDQYIHPSGMIWFGSPNLQERNNGDTIEVTAVTKNINLPLYHGGSDAAFLYSFKMLWAEMLGHLHDTILKHFDFGIYNPGSNQFPILVINPVSGIKAEQELSNSSSLLIHSPSKENNS